MLPLPIWSHATEHGDKRNWHHKTNNSKNVIEHGDVEEVNNIQPTIGKETDIIKPIVAKMLIQT
ncbi:hypothetical protein AAG906_039563 [Vitis piasezkii]